MGLIIDADSINDGSDNEIMAFGSVASAVNYLKALSAAAGGGAELQAQGDDTNIIIIVRPKGSGHVQVTSKLEVDGDFDHDGSNVGLYGTTPVAQAAAIANIAADAIDATYGTEEQNVLTDLRTKVNSILTALRGVGLIAP